MKTFAEMKQVVRAILNEAGLDATEIHPGPNLPVNPDDVVVATPYGGPGLELEGVLDGRGWQFRCIGKQQDYESAEAIATAIDDAFISHYSSRLAGKWVPSIQRVGGAPNALVTDDAERTHFVCSYIVSVELALPN